MSTASAEFLEEIRAAAARLKLTPKTLCQKAVRNHRLVDRLEAGERVTVQTVERFRGFVASAEVGKPIPAQSLTEAARAS